MIDGVIIRVYTDNDIPEICRIEKECFSQPWSEKALNEFCSNPFGRIIVAEAHGKTVGYITYSEIFEELQIANVAVSSCCRRMGIGEMLINELISEGLKNSAEIITLEVRKSNAPARRLYEKCGFCIEGERKGFYSNPKEDAVLMNYIYPPRKE